MKLQSLGELYLLKEIRKRFSSASEHDDRAVFVGIGDDAAVFSCNEGNILVTTDMMNEGIHFDLDYISPLQLGFKLVSVNVSDIYAMGGIPRFLFLNTAMRDDTDEKFFREFFDGISSALSIYGLKLLGGDISSAIKEMSFSATVVGVAERFITRAGAKPGDKIYITGSVGSSACGHEILKRLVPSDKEIIKECDFIAINETVKPSKKLRAIIDSELKEIDFDIAAPLIKRHLMPVVKSLGVYADNATSLIDVSDGLFIDLNRICDESNVGARVYLSKIPMSPQMEEAARILRLDPCRLAISGGEDYELLFTLPHEIQTLKTDKDMLPDSNCNSNTLFKTITCIGEITPDERIVIDKDGSESALSAEGYQHFGSTK